MISTRSVRARTGASALLVAALFGTAVGTASGTEPQAVGERVTVEHGELRGADDGAVVRFQGVPFAAPPVGDLRFAPPQEPAPWTGTREATAPGAPCAQPASAAAPTSSEDCLTLGVATPSGSTRASRYPVLVWIHGGSFDSGAGSDYDPRDLVTEGPLVVVTINYRLGALGFLGLPGLEGSGAFGLLDQQAALRWVRDNIAAFGGDPDNVTIAGESAGADSVCSQLGSPGAEGLFRRAVLQSGSCHGTNVTAAILPGLGLGPEVDIWKPREVAAGIGADFAASLGCADPATALDCLRGLPADRFPPRTERFWSPAIGTATLPLRPSEALATGAAPDVPVLTGTTRDEGALFGLLFFGAQPLDEPALDYFFGAAAGPRTAEAVAAYPRAGRAPTRVWADVISDRAYACPNLATARALSTGAPVYAYEFADVDAPSPIAPIPPDLAGGATHASELPYLFDYAVGDTGLSPAQERLGAQLRRYWADFAATGDPNGAARGGADVAARGGADVAARGGADVAARGGATPDAPQWPPFGADGPLLTLTSEGSTTTTAAAFAERHRCGIWG